MIPFDKGVLWGVYDDHRRSKSPGLVPFLVGYCALTVFVLTVTTDDWLAATVGVVAGVMAPFVVILRWRAWAWLHPEQPCDDPFCPIGREQEHREAVATMEAVHGELKHLQEIADRQREVAPWQ